MKFAKVILTVLALICAAFAAANARGAEQLVKNPYFTEWARAKPVGWSALGEPELWWTDSRTPAKRTVNMIRLGAGDGIMQRIAVVPGKRYFVRAWTGVSPGSPGVMIVRDVQSKTELFKRTADRPWLQEHVGFFTPAGSAVDLVFQSVKGGNMDIDNAIVVPMDVDPTPSRVAIPKIPVFYSSYDPKWTDALGAINVVLGGVQDMQHLADLRKRGVLVLTGVHVPNRKREIKDDLDAQVDELLTHWMRPFLDTKEGVFPGGSDGIIIDELDGFLNDDPEIEKWEKALGELKRLFPNKIVAVWGSNSIGALTKEGQKRSRVMEMLAKSTDLFMIEIYQATCSTSQRGYGRKLPEFATAAKVIGETCPELLPKTVVCLVTAQNVGMNFDLAADYNFLKWLRVQMTNIPLLGRDGKFGFAGIGQWVSYRARLSTLLAFERHAREVFLAETTPVALTDDDAIQAVGDPSFEAQEDSPWIFAGPARRAKYAGTELPDRHDKKVEHFQHFAEIGTGTKVGSIRQVVEVEGGACYEISAYAIPMTDKATVTVRALDGKTVLGSASETMYAPTKWWVRVPVTFRVPPEKNHVTIEVTSVGSAAAEKVAVDFVDLAPMKGLNEPVEITSIGTVAFDDLPKEIVIKGKNLLPKDVVRIGREVYCDVTFVSTEELRVLIPELPAPGAYDITVRHDDWLGEARAVTVEGGLKVEE